MQADSIISAHENEIGFLGLQQSLPMDQAVGCVYSLWAHLSTTPKYVVCQL